MEKRNTVRFLRLRTPRAPLLVNWNPSLSPVLRAARLVNNCAIGENLAGAMPDTSAEFGLAALITVCVRVSTVVGMAAALSEDRATACSVHAACAIWRNGYDERLLVFIVFGVLRAVSVVRTGRSIAILAVPKLLGVIKTLANGYCTVAMVLDFTQHVLSEVVDGLLVHIVGDDHPRFLTRFPWSQGIIENVFRDLNSAGAVVAVVACVNIIQDDMISKLTQVSKAARLGKAA